MEGFQWSMPAGSFVLCAVVFLSAVATSQGDIGDFDEHWQKRKLISDAAAEATYRHDPLEVANGFNRAVHRHGHDRRRRRPICLLSRACSNGACCAS
ncbi:hypothetical protein ABZP36_020935 [Zizania latifolia]